MKERERECYNIGRERGREEGRERVRELFNSLSIFIQGYA